VKNRTIKEEYLLEDLNILNKHNFPHIMLPSSNHHDVYKIQKENGIPFYFLRKNKIDGNLSSTMWWKLFSPTDL